MSSYSSDNLKIAVILGSTRPGRNGEAVAKWVVEQASGRDGVDYELVDLVDFPLPHLDEPIGASQGIYSQAHTREWAEKIDGYDGFVFVTPEYNHSVSGVLKNALDYLYAEWNNKAAAFVSYGAVGGVRAVEHLRGIASELQLAHVRQSVSFSLATDFENYSVFTPAPYHAGLAQVMFGQLEMWGDALKQARTEALQAAA